MDKNMSISRVSSFTIALLGGVAYSGTAVCTSSVNDENDVCNSDLDVFSSDHSTNDLSEEQNNQNQDDPNQEVFRSSHDVNLYNLDKVMHNHDKKKCNCDIPMFQAMASNIERLNTLTFDHSSKLSSLEQSMDPLTGIDGQVSALEDITLKIQQNIMTLNKQYKKIANKHVKDISEIREENKIRTEKTTAQIRKLEIDFMNTLQSELEKSAEQQMNVTKETLADVSGDLNTIKRILGAYENMPNDEVPDVNLTENNLERLRKRFETDQRRIETIEKQLGPVDDLANHQVFLDLVGETLPTEPLTIARMLTELANAYIKFRDDLPKDLEALIEQKFSEIDRFLAPLTDQINGNKDAISTLQQLLEGISEGDLQKVREIETIIADRVKEGLNEKFGGEILQLCQAVIELKFKEIAQSYESRLDNCEKELVTLGEADQDLVQKIEEQAQQLKKLETLVNGGGEGSSSDLGSLADQVSTLKVSVDDILTKLPEDLKTRLENVEKADEKISDLRDELISKLWGEGSSELSPSITEISEQLSLIQKNYDPQEIASLKKLLEEITGSDDSSSLETIGALTQRIKALEEADFGNRLAAIEGKNYDTEFDTLKLRVKTLEDGNYPQRITNISDEVAAIRNSLPERLKERLVQLEEINVDEKIEANNETFKSSLMKEIETLFSEELGPLNTSISELNDRIDEAENTLNDLNVDQKISDLKAELEDKFGNVESENYPTKEEFNALSNRVTAVEKICTPEDMNKISELINKILEIDGNVSNLDSIFNRLQNLETQVNGLNVQSLIDKNTEQDDRLTKLEEDIGEITKFTTVLSEVKSALGEVVNAMKIQSTTLSSLDGRVGVNEQNISNLSNRVSALTGAGGGTTPGGDNDYGDTSSRT